MTPTERQTEAKMKDRKKILEHLPLMPFVAFKDGVKFNGLLQENAIE